MHPDPYRNLAAAYDHISRRPPGWTRHPTLRACGGLDGIIAAIRADQPDSSQSDATVRALVGLARQDSSASTVLLHALAAGLRYSISRAVTDEYRSDALGELAVVILEGDLVGRRLGHRYIKRAESRTHKRLRRVRHPSRTEPWTVDPHPADRLIDLHDRQATPRDVADVVAARVDLQRFGAAVAAAIAHGDLAEKTWTTYADHRLRSLYVPDRERVPTRQRVAAYRAAKKLQPLIDAHLHGHAA